MTAVAPRRSTDRRAARPGRPPRTHGYGFGPALAGLTALVVLGAAGFGCSGNIGDQGGGRAPAGDGTTGPGGTGNSGGPTGSGAGTGTMPGTGAPGSAPGSNGGGPSNPGQPGGGPATEMFPAQPGHVAMRRLTRSQYNNTIHDLLGIAGDPAGEFGVDEEEGGFAANNVAPLEDLQIEKYQQAAADLADKAVANLATLMRCAPGAAEPACVDQFVRGFGRRAYRRPLTDQEVARYKTLFDTGRAGGDLASGISLVLTAMLQSPNFLYRIELGDPATATKDGVALTPWEVGTRLAFFLTNSTPDDELLSAAEAGKLKTPEGIAAEAQRLLTSPKSRDTLISFYEQWLQTDDLLTVEKDPKAYPDYSPVVRAAMRDEVLEFVDQVTRLGDGKLSTLLTTNTSYFRGPLYPIYGMGMASAAGGSILKKITLPADQRAGIFTLAGLMAKHGHADQSSPVGRGYLISSRVLCQVPPPPPPGVDNNVPAADPNVSTRVRFEQHRTKPECASCHALMDPLGVSFEIYDGVGRYRTMDGTKPVDAASELKGTKASDGPTKDAVDLMHKLADAEETRTCFAKQMFRYAFGREESTQPADTQILGDGVAALGKTGRIPDLMVAIATAPGFRTRIPVDLR
jgi:hypothetical protein